MRICLVATFPPSGRQLNEYSFHIARELQRHSHVEVIILADELDDYEFSTDEHGNSLKADELKELPGFNVIRCWKFGSLSNPARLLNTIRKLKPDVVWYHLVFSTFAASARAGPAGSLREEVFSTRNFYRITPLRYTIRAKRHRMYALLPKRWSSARAFPAG